MGNSGELVLFGLVGQKWEVGDLPLFAVPSPVQPTLGPIFDILIFTYQKLNYETIKEWKHQHPKTQDLHTNLISCFQRNAGHLILALFIQLATKALFEFHFQLQLSLSVT